MMKVTKVEVEVKCPFCGKVTKVVCSADGFQNWQEGELIQRALPELSATEREVLISGLCADCQADLYEEEDEGEDDFDEDEGISPEALADIDEALKRALAELLG